MRTNRKPGRKLPARHCIGVILCQLKQSLQASLDILLSIILVSRSDQDAEICTAYPDPAEALGSAAPYARYLIGTSNSICLRSEQSTYFPKLNMTSLTIETLCDSCRARSEAPVPTNGVVSYSEKALLARLSSDLPATVTECPARHGCTDSNYTSHHAFYSLGKAP